MESTQLNSTEVIKIRCPSCFKLYVVDSGEIHDSKPQFECVKCHTRFWFSFSPGSPSGGEILGFPSEWLKGSVEPPADSTTVSSPAPAPVKAEVRTFHCPRCEAEYNGGDKECPKCGVVFAKLDFIEDGPSAPASPHLKRFWRQVMDNYASPAMHRRFLQMAQKENNLLFASQQYARLLKAHSGDEMALQMQKEILVLTEVAAGVAARVEKSKPRRRLMPGISTMGLLVGGILIGIGFVVPAARNLIGLGVAAVFFTLAVNWIVQKAP